MRSLQQTFSGCTLKGTARHTSVCPRHGAVLYFHGGGLLYGVRDDLPEIYIQMFLQNGFDFFAFDYLLAPESSAAAIIESAFSWITWYQKEYPEVPFFIFGRSAGAYLSIQLVQRTLQTDALPPKGELLFYGYPSLDESEFQKPSAHYQKYAPISKSSIEHIIKNAPVSEGPIASRFSLYIYARQNGLWSKLVAGDDALESISVSDQMLTQFPPAFLTASSTDADVPFRISKHMSKLIPSSVFLPVYNQEHDFDRVPTEQTIALYTRMIEWLHMHTGSPYA